MNVNRSSFIAGMAAGAALAFILDPSSGRRRRALVRDQFVRAGRSTRDAADATAKDLSNRARGVAAATRSKLRGGRVEQVITAAKSVAGVDRGIDRLDRHATPDGIPSLQQAPALQSRTAR